MMFNNLYKKNIFLSLLIIFGILSVKAQNKFFIDGYHGGYWGHYPAGYTGFITDKLDENSFWKINLEIEPVTWDVVRKNDLINYNRFKAYVKDQSANGRVEFVNPTYGQSYLFNLQGESVIRQFEIGIKKIKSHFPEAEFHTYSSEEPCFTSALPQILKSFGYSYASLKNPNTGWGGYTRAFGGELINWKGSDGSILLTVPRYETEALLKNSTWQTEAWNNSKSYINAAYQYGIKNPIGMCIQDAGWKNGPWLGKPIDFTYKIWRDYIQNTANKSEIKTWNLNQEDIQVSLVWGAQILQQMAQRTRVSENKIISSEKIDVINSIANHQKIIGGKFENAWQNLLLAQHHDSWIVPYNIVNREKNWNWASQVKYWTNNSDRLCDSLSKLNLKKSIKSTNDFKLTVYNTLAYQRKGIAKFRIEDNLVNPVVISIQRKILPSQVISENGIKYLLFEVEVPAMTYANYLVKSSKNKDQPSSSHVSINLDRYTVKNENFDVVFNAAKGGTIESFIAKKLNGKEFVNTRNSKSFNEMRGYFYNDSTFYSSKDKPAKVSISEDGPLMTRLKIEGMINIHPFIQYITFIKYTENIDIETSINWQGNPGIGQDYAQKKGWKANDVKKAFYNDSLKFSAVFPLDLSKQKVYKNSAFDVMESEFKNTYFNTWDSIKNNIIVNWTDITDQNGNYGMALLNDHTTSYSHGEDGVLGLTLQYSGMGLWGMNYSIKGASKFHYALLPHQNKWDKADIWNKNAIWNEPLLVLRGTNLKDDGKPLIQIEAPGYDVSSVTMDDSALLFRVFNSSSSLESVDLNFNIPIKKADLVELNHAKIKALKLVSKQKDITTISLSIPQFGLRTVKVYVK